MADYIEREALCKILENWRDAHADVDDEQGCGLLEDVICEVDAQTAADVAPVVHGQWETNSDRPDSLICSVCKCGFDMWKHDPHNYCPNCGAMMAEVNKVTVMPVIEGLQMRLIDADALMGTVFNDVVLIDGEVKGAGLILAETVEGAATVDAVPVVRCRDCINAEPLERNCELNGNFYMHCRLWRGEECKNVWHKYKRYYRDYSLVQHDDFCSSGERKDGDTDA